MRFYEPLFRSRKKGDEVVLLSDIAIIALMTLILPPAIAFLVLTLADNSGDFTGSMGRLGGAAGPIAFIFVASPIFTVIALPLGITFGLFALRRGIAGLVFAIAAAAAPFLLVALISLLVPPTSDFPILMLAMAPFSMTYAAVMWFALRWRRPGALIAPRR